MANVYGSRNKNQFRLPSVESKETYYTLVNPENGEITLKRLNRVIPDSPIGGFAEAQDQTVGTIAATGPNKGKFIPNEGIFGIGGITETERKAFAQQPQAVQTVKDQAAKTSNNAQQALGVDQTTRQSRTNQILGTGQATTPPSGDGEGSTPFNRADLTPGQNLLNQISIGDRTGTRPIEKYPDNQLLKYPVDMSGTQDCVTFTMLKYVPRKLSVNSSTLDVQENRSISNTRRGSTVVLPIQPNISDSNNVKWGAGDMNTLQGMAASVAMKAITDNNNFAATAAEIESVAAGVLNAKDSIGAAVAAQFAGEAAKVKGLLTRVTGGIINPNTELLFDGPDLRTFNFTFSLSAREPKEAKNIRNIIRFFKQGMSVKRADTGLFLKSPHTFEIKYLFNGKDHPWINKIKECALVSCNVNYTPAGNYATYEDGSMTQYDISLSFSELEPIYDDDYAEADKAVGGGLDSSIGY
jgi:hypothetical protein